MTLYKSGENHKYGLVKKSTGEVDEITAYVDDNEEQYIVTRGNLMYVGKPSSKSIYEINLTSKASRRLNDPAINPIRFITEIPGSAGDAPWPGLSMMLCS